MDVRRDAHKLPEELQLPCMAWAVCRRGEQVLVTVLSDVADAVATLDEERNTWCRELFAHHVDRLAIEPPGIFASLATEDRLEATACPTQDPWLPSGDDVSALAKEGAHALMIDLVWGLREVEGRLARQQEFLLPAALSLAHEFVPELHRHAWWM